MAKKEVSALEEKLSLKQESSWLNVNKKQQKDIFEFSEGYKEFLNKAKTEREVVEYITTIAKKNSFKPIDEVKKLKPGNRVIVSNLKKNIALAVIGKEPIRNGMKILTSHIDSPRLDLKQKPLYEDADSELALFKTHYYGGVKKYQWVNIPLAIHGVISRNDGKIIDVIIGEDPDDPVFVIGDLLPHLARKAQGKRELFDGIKGEELRLIVGSMPLKTEKEAKQKLKLNILDLLHKKYGVVEEDLISAELEVVPAIPTRDVGLDRSLVGGYGHDDRVCAYASLMAICELKDPDKTAMTIFYDKEEVGSYGATGAQSDFLELCTGEILEKLTPDYKYITLKKALANSKAISGDVDAGMHPLFKEVYEKQNAAKLGYGIVICKYGGARGKLGANDASAEYIGEIRSLFNKKKIPWQYAEMGKVDEGGGGTVARFITKYNMEVVDCGPPVISMHSPFEIVSKADLYFSYKAYKEFQLAK
jgi:aspartyl aminopeptidase